MKTVLPTPEELGPVTSLCTQFLDQLDRILLGQQHLHRMVLIGILCRGHILLEGLPGLGKTALVKAIGRILRLEFRRVQFTPDLMPSDILGAHILEDQPGGGRAMVFRPGPVFTNLLLADEINRASPKTQSALLEAMQEQSVTLLGQTHALPDPLFVLASQNPIELEGTYPLPEAQLDRFLFRLLVTSVDAGVLADIVQTRRRGIEPEPDWTMDGAQLDGLFAMMDRIHLPTAVADFIARLVVLTHADAEGAPEVIGDYVTYGASPRAAIALAEACRAHALIAGRPTAGFEDVRAVAPAVLNHRLILNYKARFDGVTAAAAVEALLGAAKDVELDLPNEISAEGAS